MGQKPIVTPQNGKLDHTLSGGKPWGVLAPQKAIFRAKNRLKTAENGDFHLLSVLECFFEKNGRK